MSAGTRNYETGSDKVYRVVMIYKDGREYYAAGPYTTAAPARRELKKLLKTYPLEDNPFYVDMFIEEGQVDWSRIDNTVLKG